MIDTLSQIPVEDLEKVVNARKQIAEVERGLRSKFNVRMQFNGAKRHVSRAAKAGHTMSKAVRNKIGRSMRKRWAERRAGLAPSPA